MHVSGKYKEYAHFSPPYYAIAFRVCYFFTRGSCRERFNDKLGDFPLARLLPLFLKIPAGNRKARVSTLIIIFKPCRRLLAIGSTTRIRRGRLTPVRNAGYTFARGIYKYERHKAAEKVARDSIVF